MSKTKPKVHAPKGASQRRTVSAAGNKPSAKGPSPLKQRRMRRPDLLPTPGPAQVPYALSHPDLKGMTPAQVTRMFLDSEAWKQVMKPVLDELDRARTVPGKEKPLYTSEELESVLLYQRLSGRASFKRARNEIAGDRDEARRLLGFDRPRNRGRRVVKLRDGVPSEATVSRHRARIGELRRNELHEEVERRVMLEHLQVPEFQEEVRELNLDGTAVKTHYTAPIIDPTNGQTVNDARVTAPEAGYVPYSAGPDKSGHGWSAVHIVTATGLPLARALGPMNASERELAAEAVEKYAEHVAPRLPREGLSVLSADGAFAQQELRKRLRELGIVENIHLVSHGDEPRSRANAAKNNAKRIPIAGYPNWFTNGHRELKCACGAGHTYRRFGKDRHGRAVVRVEGSCKPRCGSITITSGDWRLAQNPTRWVRIDPSNPNERPDYYMGNSLTFNDPLAAEHGRRRFGHNEGFHGTLATRFGLIKDKRWFRRQAQVRTEFAIVGTAMHLIAMEQRRRAAARAQTAASGSGQTHGAPQAQALPGLAA